jgi:hypothetical protein
MPPVLATLFAAFLLLIPITSIADVPRIIHFQGMLTSEDGSPLTGNYTATFGIYSQSEGGAPEWSETREISVVEGTLTVTLGLDEELDLPFSQQYWLGIAVGDDDEMVPRYRLASAPYSMWTAVSDSSISTHWSGISGIPSDFADGIDNVGAIGDGHSLDAPDGNPTDALFVDSTGNVGIGTISPAAELEVSSDAPTLKLTSTSSAPEILFHTDGPGAYDWRLKVFGNDLIAEVSADDGGHWIPLLQFDGSGIDMGSFYVYDGFGTANTNRVFEFDAYDPDGKCIWGDKSMSTADLVLKSNDDVRLHLNQSGGNVSLFQVISSSGSSVLSVDEVGDLWAAGDIWAAGSKSAVVSSDLYGERKLYSIESPEVWFEDFGSGRLANGSATIPIEPVFASTVNLDEGYRVFVTPVNGWASLYVSDKSGTSFRVIDAEGSSNIEFDYRVVAKRRGYEDVRLERNSPSSMLHD